MISRAVWVVVAMATWSACGSARRSKRAVVLDKIPAGVTALVVADGPSLAHPRTRRVIDVLRPELPSSLGCAIDVALGGDEVAIGIAADRSFTLAIATRANVECAALSQIERGIWVATGGGAAIASEQGLPVLADATFDRARSYLTRARIGFAMAFQGGELIGTAQPDPLEAWLAFDSSPELSPALEKALRDRLARMGSEPTTSPFAARISLVREGPQVVARLERGDDVEADLAAAVRTLREWSKPASAAGPAAPPPAFACPAPVVDPIVRCSPLPASEPIAGIALTARSAKAVAALVTASRCSPVVANQQVRGLRLEVDIPALGLVAGDVLFGSAGRLVTSKAILVETLAREAATGRTSLTVQRGILERAIRIEEAPKE